MNEIDLIIVGAVVLLALLGLMTGLLKPLSGIGGLILGIIAAIQFGGEVATLLADHIDNETVRSIAGFVAIVLGVAVATRLTAVLIKKVLSSLVLGWLDHVAGAVGGAGLGIVLAGTVVYILPAVSLIPAGELLASSKLATEISRASLVVTDRPWCSSIDDAGAENAQPCANLTGLLNKYLGRHIPDKINDFLGEDKGSVVEAVRGVLTDGPPRAAEIIGGGEFDDLLGKGQETIIDSVEENLSNPPQ